MSINAFCFAISILLIILGFVFRRSKFLYIVQFLWIWILIGFNCGGMDYDNYEFMYQSYANINNVHAPEIFYKLMCYSANNIGMDMVAMNAISTFVALGVMFWVISRHTKSICMVASMFMIFPFVDNAIQKRFLLASSIMFMAFHFLLTSNDKNKIRHRLLYVLLCLLATQFHSAMPFFLIFILVDFKQVNINGKFMFFAVLISFLLISFVPGILANLFNTVKIYDYFYDESMRLDSPVKIGIFCLIHFMFVYLLDKAMGKNVDDEQKKIKAVLLLSLVFLPFYIYNSTFFRIVRLCIILGYVGVARRYDKRVQEARTNNLLPLLVSYLAINFLFFYCISGNFGYDGLVRPIFEQNVVMQHLSGEF